MLNNNNTINTEPFRFVKAAEEVHNEKFREVTTNKGKSNQPTKNDTVDEIIYQQTETFINDTLSK